MAKEKLFLHSIQNDFDYFYKDVILFTLKNPKKAVKKMEEFIKFLNTNFKPYGGKVELIGGELYLSFDEPFKLKGGIYTSAIVLLKSNKVLHIAVDNIKMGWQLFNKYITVHELRSFPINDIKFVYFLVTDKYTTVPEFDKKLQNRFLKSDLKIIINKIKEILEQYNTRTFNNQYVINEFKNTIKKHKFKDEVVKEQFELLIEYIELVTKDFVCQIDMHDGNVMYDKKRDIWLITDPIYSSMLEGYKVPNHIPKIILEGYYKNK